MHCSEFELIWGEETGGTSAAAAQHAKECASCGALAADLELIRIGARALAIEQQEPPARVWSNLRAQLRAEGIIREQVQDTGWLGMVSWLRRPYAAAAYAAVALLAIGLVWQPSTGTAGSESASASQKTMTTAQRNLDAMEQAFAMNVANSTSDVDAALRKNLRVVDNFIAVCEKAVKQEPQNEAAREYLYGAYQQKAELLNTAMEHSLTGEE